MEEGSSGQRTQGQIHSRRDQGARSWRRGKIQEVGRLQGREEEVGSLERLPIFHPHSFRKHEEHVADLCLGIFLLRGASVMLWS